MTMVMMMSKLVFMGVTTTRDRPSMPSAALRAFLDAQTKGDNQPPIEELSRGYRPPREVANPSTLMLATPVCFHFIFLVPRACTWEKPD